MERTKANVPPQYQKLGFGEYRDTMLLAVPDDYLEWAEQEFAPGTFKKVIVASEIRRRKSLNVWVGKSSKASR